jgi:hypothetical protein
VQAHIVHKECVDKGKLTSEKLRRDIVEPSSAEVQGMYMKNTVLSSEKDRVTENFVGLCQVGIEGVQVCTRKTLYRVQREEYQRKILTELLNTL